MVPDDDVSHTHECATGVPSQTPPDQVKRHARREQRGPLRALPACPCSRNNPPPKSFPTAGSPKQCESPPLPATNSAASPAHTAQAQTATHEEACRARQTPWAAGRPWSWRWPGLGRGQQGQPESSNSGHQSSSGPNQQRSPEKRKLPQCIVNWRELWNLSQSRHCWRFLAGYPRQRTAAPTCARRIAWSSGHSNESQAARAQEPTML